MRLAVIFLFLVFASGVSGQSILGFWKNIGDEDGKEKSIIQIYEEDGKIHGKVIELLEAATVTHCKKCKDERKGKPLEGMVILWDLESEDKGNASGGKILDPKKGKTYDCKIELKSADLLSVRGYIKAPIFGRSQEWHRTDYAASKPEASSTGGE